MRVGGTTALGRHDVNGVKARMGVIADATTFILRRAYLYEACRVDRMGARKQVQTPAEGHEWLWQASPPFMTYLEVDFLAYCWKVDFFLKDVPFLIELDSLTPVIERSGDKHLVGVVRPGVSGNASQRIPKKEKLQIEKWNSLRAAKSNKKGRRKNRGGLGPTLIK
ncbi:hypothetical protein BJY01DRAFT_36434 [Aspergillus pseudoustus]|uniref:Uncharacterized protein n=1 Tax=Aspergillus pseudoustus TaxID=1810923 RepID=A0ABR4KRB3_9EURO